MALEEGASTLTDELEAFREETTEEKHAEERGRLLELLVFTQGTMRLGLPARAVDSVIPWRTPAPLPLAAAHVEGVVQDRGRILIVMKVQVESTEVNRIIVCTTQKGLVGIPATETEEVGNVLCPEELETGAPLSTDRGTMTLLDPDELVQSMTGD